MYKKRGFSPFFIAQKSQALTLIANNFGAKNCTLRAVVKFYQN